MIESRGVIQDTLHPAGRRRASAAAGLRFPATINQGNAPVERVSYKHE
jgi:hypothetical protein